MCITDDDKCLIGVCCPSRRGSVKKRDVLLQPFLVHKYANLKIILIKRSGLTTPKRVNKVISGEKLGSYIFLLVFSEDFKSWIWNIGSCREGRDTPCLFSTNASFNQSPFGQSPDSASPEDLFWLFRERRARK